MKHNLIKITNEKKAKINSEEKTLQSLEETKNGISWNDIKNKENFEHSKFDISSYEQMKPHIVNEYSEELSMSYSGSKQSIMPNRNTISK